MSAWTQQEGFEKASSYCPTAFHTLFCEEKQKVRAKQNRINRRVNKPCHLNKHKIKRRVTKGLTYRHVAQCIRIELMINCQTKLFS